MITFETMVLASAGTAIEGPQQSPYQMIIWFGLMIGLFYFLLIRPQRRREKEKRAMLEAVKTGDRVVFAGGLIGIVSNVKDKIFVVKVADNVKVEAARFSVIQVLDKGQDPVPEPDRK